MTMRNERNEGLFGGSCALVLVALAACTSSEPVSPAASQQSPAAETHAEHAEQASGQAPARTNADGARVFGDELDQAMEVTALTAVIASPAEFSGRVVKTEGVISAVCQRMGCWMELRPTAAEGPAIRVPMAGHSFFLPRDVAGRRATIQGTVAVEPLDEATREHLESEGAQATGEALSIEATGVVVH
jgi:hypothetical protein